MKLTLKRVAARPDGIFYSLLIDGEKIADALTHSYEHDGAWIPKTPDGNYLCKRGTHQLHGGLPFETFEIMGVPGHQGILFHAGNWNRDSEGCYLLGELNTHGPAWDVENSRATFKLFMAMTAGEDNIPLTVT